jgi:hypothetical protein
MYIDPSRVDMLARYSARLAAATPEQLGALEGEVRLFIEALWTEASAEARARFLDAVRRVGPPMPWSAITAPPGARGGPSAAPAALELILGQADPDDEGVPAYRVDPKSDQGARALEALQAWDRATMEAIGAPAGWHLEALDRESAPDGAAPTTAEADTNTLEPSTPAPSRSELAVLAAAGWGVAAAMVTFARRRT